ncbi:MAG: hypothetical protein ABIM19_02675 [candidate division WOR-3 bacterium]
MFLLLLLGVDEASLEFGFSYWRNEGAWSSGYIGAILDEYPIARLSEFERPELFGAQNLHFSSAPLSFLFTGKRGPWSTAAKGLFAMREDTLSSDRLSLADIGLKRDLGSWAWCFGFSYSDFSYRQRIFGTWRNWTLDTRTAIPGFGLVFPVGEAWVSSTMRFGLAQSVAGDVLLPVGLDVELSSDGGSFRLSYLTLSNTAAGRGLVTLDAVRRWSLCESAELTLSGEMGIGLGGNTKRYGGNFSSEITKNMGSLSFGKRLSAISYMDDSLNLLAIQDCLIFSWAKGPVSLITKPRVSYYSSGQWRYGALGGVRLSRARLSMAFLAGRLDLAEGLYTEANLELKLW